MRGGYHFVVRLEPKQAVLNLGEGWGGGNWLSAGGWTLLSSLRLDHLIGHEGMDYHAGQELGVEEG